MTGDIPRLVELITLLFDHEGEFTPDAGKQTLGLQAILGNEDHGRLFCAVGPEGAVGMVSILFSVSTAEGGKVAWLEDMIVHPGWRGAGIGERLIRHAIGEARSAGCLRLTLLTAGSNSGAIRFYSRLGFTESDMVPMRLML